MTATQQENAVPNDGENTETSSERRPTCSVSAGRLQHDRGDINASYSADRIASGQPVRKPFQHDGTLWVCTGISGSGLTASGSTEHEAYRLIPVRAFEGKPTSYSERTGTADAAETARHDPKGFYHGIVVKFTGEALVLRGPPLRFVPSNAPLRPGADPEPPEPEQLGLF
jgi:hypothetical protein